MIHRILLAVDDSPAALAAVRIAVELAARTDAAVRALTVVTDRRVAEPVPPDGDGVQATLERRATTTVLKHVAGVAQRSAVPVETALLAGEPAPCILDEARAWSADMIVVGRAGGSGTGAPYIGAQTQHVLEFAEVPVLVVPASHGGDDVQPYPVRDPR